MVKENRLDTITNLTKERISRVVNLAGQQFKNTNPYRQVPVSKEERITQFLQMSPEKEQFARQNFGDEAVNAYIDKMNQLITENKNA